MKKLFLSFLTFACLLLQAAKAQTNAQRAAKADSILQAYTDKKMFNGSVLIAKDGKILLSKGYGTANFSDNVPNTPTTKFKLASVSKQFTAMCILILQEKGKLSTDDKLNKFIADYPKGDKITIHHLLTHTSGIVNFTSLPLYDSIMTRPQTLEQEIGYFKNLPLEFDPGTKHKYSNSGYVLLTYIIEKASGQKYGDFIKENIFMPLGMKNSGLYNNREVLKNVALGYTEGENEMEHVAYIDMSIPAGAGALYSTVEDMYLWDQALYTEKLVKKATLEKMFTPFIDNYAYGWMIDNFKGHKMIFHNGGIQGFSTIMNRFPDDNMCIVVLKNVDNQVFFSASKILRSIMLGEKYELPVERKIASIDKKIYPKLVGEYELVPGFVMSVTTEDGKLYTQATNQPRLEIFPESEYRYFTKVVDALIEFKADDKGNITSFTLYQGGQALPARRIK